MEKMDMHSRNEYLKVLRERYFKAKTKKEKSQVLDEYCSNIGQSRKYVIRKIHRSDPKLKKGRKGRRFTTGKLEQLWPGYGKSLIILVASGLSLSWKEKWIG
jgi:hypothetical protein